ncbi:MAG: GntG family PLP-dependent aldolase [Bacteroidota bacterium]|nr:GntG family PLP-dependent aldolase [Bacteroidota bacterium]
MMKAEVGDDVFREDPTVNLLEKTAADLFGMEGALYCASGTMGNQIAIKCHTQPADEVICEREAHVYIYEGGGIAFNSGSQVRALAGDRGRITADQISDAINPDDVHKAKTSLVCLENTSNRGGGSCYDLDEIKKIRTVCDERKLALHLDGARLFNALVARKENPATYGKLFNSISVCFNKGLGCPAGSIILGTASFIHQARRIRKLFGGGMRQTGFLAATALYALEHHVERLAEDHAHARQLADALRSNPIVKNVLPVETNLVIFELITGEAPKIFVDKMKTAGILLLPISATRLRMVTHLDISAEMTDQACSILKATMI